jgi:NADH-quinone oxidoreductase subunit J
MTYDVVFGVATALAIGSGLGVVLAGNPFYAALSLIANLASLATLYLLLQADFLAAAQVIVYAGAVMIMFLFVIAYLGGRAEEPTRGRPWWQVAAAVVASGAIVAEIVFAVAENAFRAGPKEGGGFGSAQHVADALLSRYLLAFEATSILLLVAAVGGVILGARRPGLRERGARDPFAVARPEAELPLQAAIIDLETRFDVRPLEQTRTGRREEEGS